MPAYQSLQYTQAKSVHEQKMSSSEKLDCFRYGDLAVHRDLQGRGLGRLIQQHCIDLVMPTATILTWIHADTDALIGQSCWKGFILGILQSQRERSIAPTYIATDGEVVWLL